MPNEWKEFENRWTLQPGDEVRISTRSNKLAGKVGIVRKLLNKNIAINIDGNEWRVSPSLIEAYRKGSPENLQEMQQNNTIKTNSDGLRKCHIGDVVLMYRGKFDVVLLMGWKGEAARCKALDGRGKGNTYLYNPKQFVQKLDNSWLQEN